MNSLPPPTLHSFTFVFICFIFYFSLFLRKQKKENNVVDLSKGVGKFNGYHLYRDVKKDWKGWMDIT